jgi:hypothetical protein
LANLKTAPGYYPSAVLIMRTAARHGYAGRLCSDDAFALEKQISNSIIKLQIRSGNKTFGTGETDQNCHLKGYVKGKNGIGPS